ncbi:conserved hypothetical protein [Histoplasma mississippiense (nom. inval.)]|uniref:conserved hypothetical protein n=1 Tax=Ajellomyces capsulatus (strain NAm1 / WU24) TaxID=2059318 RepID=UPI000157B7C2|nr:conserved hypothetical protein [Histoplasma mississippiense (nom. inval.)]EDN03457.1 conserved hypothetical protein [Histoplasma mississippiense (nom. inval.)]
MHPATNASSPDSHSSSVSTPGTGEPISDMETPSTPWNEPFPDDLTDGILDLTLSSKSPPSTTKRRRRASTVLISQSSEDVEKILGSGQGGTHVLEKICCGGGCCKLQPLQKPASSSSIHLVIKPKNQAFESLKLHLGPSWPIGKKGLRIIHLNSSNHTPHVTDYPLEGGDVDFVVGGAIGICPQNSDEVVDEVFNLLSIPKMVRDKRVMVNTTTGRWPTVWGDEKPRSLLTTRRELLSWCSDLQSYPPTKQMFRLLADPTPLDYLLSILNTLMPRFYSLSQDPLASCTLRDGKCRRLIEIAVTIHESPDWHGGRRTGVGSGFLERKAKQLLRAEELGDDISSLNLHIPMFRGLMANPLAREFVSDGPMLLIGAGVGVAPFRGFVQRRLRSANCANKVWVLQGIRDSLLDELYSGEWGVHEDTVKRVVQSRRGEGKYVQEEVRNQADLVWFVINSLDGRVFVCGSSKGMGEGVEAALVDVAVAKGNLNREEAKLFWQGKKDAGQYIAISQFEKCEC